MTVLLNKWNGQQFESDARCSCCGKLATVKEVYDPVTNVLFRTCKGCLLTMVAEIDRAILENTI